MPKYSAAVLFCLTLLISTAVCGEAELNRNGYAVIVTPENIEGPAADNVRNIGYLLGDPMVGNFTLENVAAGDEEAGLVAISEKTGATSGAEVAFVLFKGGSDGHRSEAREAFLGTLSGKVKVIVIDETTEGVEGEKASLEVAVQENEAGEWRVTFGFTGAADAKNSPASMLLAAFRGNADKDRNRRVTVGEFAGFLREKTQEGPEVDLGETGETVIMTYRSPKEVAESLGADEALQLAGTYNQQQRWVEALLVLREIKDAKVTEPLFKEETERAQGNLALEARYGGENKGDNIQRDVDAGLSLLSDMVLLANLNYVKDVDNRDLFAAGARNLTLLLENRRLRGEFAGKADDSQVTEFELFLKETVAHVYEKDGLPESDFQMRVRRVLLENDATVKLPNGAVVTEFLYGVPSALDPNTDYIPSRAYKEFRDDTKGHFGGLGIEITLEDKDLTVVTPLDGTPAAEAGLLPGDHIIAINGESTEGMELTDAVDRLRGPIGTSVMVTVIHKGATESSDVELVRADIRIESIKGYAIDLESGRWRYLVDAESKIGYVRMTDFKEDTPEDLDKAVNFLTAEGVRGLVLDLRFNHGGLLTSGVKVSDRFLSEGTIVTMQGAHSRATSFKAHYFKTYKDFPVVILVNDQSASAAEIVAGALQDNSRAIILGTKTFGKGTVQTIYELEHGQSALKLTTAKYYTPSGVCIHREPYSDEGGLSPDVEVSMTDEQYASLLEVWHLRGLKKEARDRLMDMERELAKKNPDFKVADPDSFVDVQLEKALEILRADLRDGAEVNVAEDAASKS